ncbi:hypothetical protein Daesc_007268 [Daldinia eschscholtzii]|uniref:DUF6536 domain-containing protein n=1 Tax=Daldinia eschscholtzii TaxID=292717 RepID=A0AAX6ME67_9PEZI
MTLHLLINVVSTLVFKTACWFCLFISSIPIHLLFNSTIFETDYRGSDFHLTIATEEFLNGGSFYAPGGSLAQAGFSIWYNEFSRYIKEIGYGSTVNLTDYASKTSDVMKNITATATNAAKWERIEISECKKEYIDCSGLKRHRNLVLIINKPGGWIRDETWHLIDNQTAIWDRYVPADRPNHLFYDTQCMMLALRYPVSTECINTCIGAFGIDEASGLESMYVESRDWQYDFFGAIQFVSGNGTPVEMPIELVWDDIMGGIVASGLQPGATNLSVEYCLADTLDRVCHIGLSPTLLLTVTLCVVFKTCTAILVTVVLCRQNQAPLVTLGDAMESFIEKPDPVSDGMCTIGQTQMRNSRRSNRSFLLPEPRQWKALERRRWAVVPTPVWISSYFLFAIGIGICAYFFADIRRNGLLTDMFLTGIRADPSLPPTTAVALGYSGYSLLVMLTVSCFLILLPAILSLKKLPSNMVIIGSNSLALSAACHVSRLSYAVTSSREPIFTDVPTSSRFDHSPTLKSPMRSHTPFPHETYADQRSGNDSIEMQNLTLMLSTTPLHSSWPSTSSKKSLLERPEEYLSEAGGEQPKSQFTKLARSKIRWGVVKMPPEWHAEYDNDDAPVEHLSFGVEEDEVTPPEPGRLYA